MTATTNRAADLRRILIDRQRELTDGQKRPAGDVRPTGIELELVQVKAETLARIETALVRLGVDQYGKCVECDAEISIRRLQSLPFAVRCQTCEDQRDHARAIARQLGWDRGDRPLFACIDQRRRTPAAR